VVVVGLKAQQRVGNQVFCKAVEWARGSPFAGWEARENRVSQSLSAFQRWLLMVADGVGGFFDARSRPWDLMGERREVKEILPLR
jgi:hypothetical protein